MLYLLDADTLITGDRGAYPLARFPVFWQWLAHQGATGRVKVAVEQFEEVTAGRGDLVDWLKDAPVKAALLLDEEADPSVVAQVVAQGYAPDLDEQEVEQLGRDPFLIAHALREPGRRTVVTFEVSKPSKQRANRKVPDVCRAVGVPCCDLYRLIRDLDFTTDWRP